MSEVKVSVEELLGHSFLKEEAVASSVTTNPAVSTIKMLEALEGVLSPNTYKKTKEGFRLVGQLEKWSRRDWEVKWIYVNI